MTAVHHRHCAPDDGERRSRSRPCHL